MNPKDLKRSDSVLHKYILVRGVPLFVILFIIAVMLFWYTAIFRLPFEKRKIIVNGKEFRLWVVQTENERERGLQYIIWMPKGTGMLFEFPHPDRYCFWNKNTLMPLRLIFRREGKVVQELFLPAITKGEVTVCPDEPIDSVIEMAVD